MLGYALAILVVLVSQGWFFRRTVSSEVDARDMGPMDRERWRREIFSYAWPFAVWGIPAWMQLVSDRWALQVFSSVDQVGRYAVLYQLGYYPITISTDLVVQLVYPVFFQRAGGGSDPSRLRRVYNLNWQLTVVALAVTAIAVGLAYALHGPIFRLLVAPQYRAVSWMLPGMVLAGGLFATAQLAVVALLSSTQTRVLVLPKVVTAAVGLLLNILGAAYYGVPGVVTATAVASAIYLFWVLWLVRTRQMQTQSESSKADDW
jgi:O-antigen/teichoic acid export membrane protein